MKTRKIRVSNNIFGLPFVVHIPFDCNTPLSILAAVQQHPLVEKGSYPLHDELWHDAINNR